MAIFNRPLRQLDQNRSQRLTRNLKMPGPGLLQMLPNLDIWLLAACLVLLVFGVAMIRSTTLSNTLLQVLPESQLRWASYGVIAMVVFALFDYRLFRPARWVIWGLIVFWLGLVIVTGFVSFGAQRWVQFGGLNIQPAELAKILSLIYVADFFARNRHQMNELKTVIKSLLLAGIPIGFVLLQPNLSTSIMLGVIWFSIAWAAGLRWKHMAMGLGAGVLVAPVAWLFLAEYQRNRVLQFINPSINTGAQYNIDQALISIGSGGLWGQGYGSATQVQSRFLKVRHTDFIFAATGAEFGLIGAMLLLMVLAFVVWRILRIGRNAADAYGAYICYGFAAMIFVQTIVNVGMNLNLLPVAGLPLPLVSYGGSALVTFFVGLGLVQSVALRQKSHDY